MGLGGQLAQARLCSFQGLALSTECRIAQARRARLECGPLRPSAIPTLRVTATIASRVTPLFSDRGILPPCTGTVVASYRHQRPVLARYRGFAGAIRRGHRGRFTLVCHG